MRKNILSLVLATLLQLPVAFQSVAQAYDVDRKYSAVPARRRNVDDHCQHRDLVGQHFNRGQA
jgi:hypothetical protein